MNSDRPADWQLPAGVDRGLWDYLHDPGVAANYDDYLAGSSLFHLDVPFVDKHCPLSGRLVDLGCGSGRLLIDRARRGGSGLGVDLSLPMLDTARAKAAQLGVTIDLVQANITELDGLAEESFDSAACLFSTLGMVRGAAQRRKVVEQAYRLLKPGGRFVLHVHNRWFNLWDPQGRRWLIGNLFSKTPGDRVMPVHQGIANLTLHLFTRREIVRLLRSVGFRMVEVKPISLRADGEVSCRWWFGNLRAYGYLIAAQRG